MAGQTFEPMCLPVHGAALDLGVARCLDFRRANRTTQSGQVCTS